MLSKFEEMKLVAQCMATDNREAFSRLVVAYEPGVKRFLMNMVGGDASLTDDLAQETFIKAWLAIRSFRGLSGFKTWLYRIAVNEFVSYRRKRSVEAEIPYSAFDVDVAGNKNGVRPHDATEASMDVASLLKLLPENERIVSLLFYLEDQPIKKISQITSMPEGTVKSHLNRARLHMAKVMGKN